MIRVEIVNVFLTEKNGEFIVLLKADGDPRTLPISIGQLEAQSIAKELYHASFPRPLTHDLFKSAVEQLGSKITRAIICDLVDNTFYARLFLEAAGKVFEIDSRPSDAIALALRFAAPVFVEEKVMNASGIIIPSDEMNDRPGKVRTAGDGTGRKKKAGEIPPLEALKMRLAKAVQKERYEEAAKLRDEISKLTESN
jgi:bifunctional DNase/RNase